MAWALRFILVVVGTMRGFGYARRGDQWIADALASDAIRDAFHLIVECQGAWREVAEALNKQDYTRRNGQKWTPDSVRDLTAVTTYCGYLFCAVSKWTKL